MRRQKEKYIQKEGRAGDGAALFVDPRIKSGDDLLRRERRNKSAVPAERLRFSGRALAEHDVDQCRAAEVHGFVEGAADVLRVLDKEALAAKGFHDAVIARA